MPGEQPPIVVVVESDAEVRDVVEASLSPAGYRVIGVADSAAALEALRTEPPDLLLLDFALPATEGSVLLDALAAGVFRAPAIFLVGPRDLRGSFEFHPGDPGAGAPLVESFEELLLKGCRRLDEGRRS